MGLAFGREKNKRKIQQRGYATNTKINTKERRRKTFGYDRRRATYAKSTRNKSFAKKAFFSKVFTFIFTHNDTFLGWFSNKEHTKVAFKQNLHSTYYGNRNNSNNPMRERGFCFFSCLLFIGTFNVNIFGDETKNSRTSRNFVRHDVQKIRKNGECENEILASGRKQREKKHLRQDNIRNGNEAPLRKGTSSANTNRVATVIAFGELKYFRSSSFINVFSLGLAYFFLVVFCFSFHSFCHIKLSSWRKKNVFVENEWGRTKPMKKITKWNFGS